MTQPRRGAKGENDRAGRDRYAALCQDRLHCDYPPLSPAATKAARDRWKGFREKFREDWGKKFGQWPEEAGESWPGHHIRDLKHGGDPVDPNNIMPAPTDVHDIFNLEYPRCYDGQPPWNTVGPDLPYLDNGR